MDHKDHSHHSSKLVIDPVCGMKIDSETAKGGKSTFQGNEYFFCNPKCKIKFDADPLAHLHKDGSEKVVTDADKERIYVCPMHPDVRQKGPGNCPICGMALESEEISLEPETNPELVDFTKRLKISAALAIPLLLLAMSDLIPDQPVQHTLPHWVYAGLQFLLATPVVLWGGLPFFERGWTSVKTWNFNMFTLIAIGTGVAHLFPLC